MSDCALIFEITKRCNNSCLYCYNVWHEGEYPESELSFEEIKYVFENNIFENKISFVTLAGGEPLLREDVFDIAKLISSRKIRTGIATNAVMLTSEIIEQAVLSGITYCEISLPSANKQSYRELCGTDSFSEVKKAIVLAKKARIFVTVGVVVNKMNLTAIKDIAELAFALTADALSINRFVPGGKGLRNALELTISDMELESTLHELNSFSVSNNFKIRIAVPVENCIIKQSQYSNLHFSKCFCGDGRWIVDPAGNLRICEQTPAILGSLLQNKFSDLINSDSVVNFRNRNLHSHCNICKAFDSCGGGCRILRNSNYLREETAGICKRQSSGSVTGTV